MPLRTRTHTHQLVAHLQEELFRGEKLAFLLILALRICRRSAVHLPLQQHKSSACEPVCMQRETGARLLPLSKMLAPITLNAENETTSISPALQPPFLHTLPDKHPRAHFAQNRLQPSKTTYLQQRGQDTQKRLQHMAGTAVACHLPVLAGEAVKEHADLELIRSLEELLNHPAHLCGGAGVRVCEHRE